MIRIPAPLLKLAGMLGSLKAMITGKAGRLTWSAAYLLCLDNYYSGKKAEMELFVKYTPMETSVANAWEWFKENEYC